jgi:hypothetical protein
MEYHIKWVRVRFGGAEGSSRRNDMDTKTTENYKCKKQINNIRLYIYCNKKYNRVKHFSLNKNVEV